MMQSHGSQGKACRALPGFAPSAMHRPQSWQLRLPLGQSVGARPQSACQCSGEKAHKPALGPMEARGSFGLGSFTRPASSCYALLSFSRDSS